jgi:hypothetical protein
VTAGQLQFSWQLHLRNQGMDHGGIEADLKAAASVLSQAGLNSCDTTVIDIYEIETAFANEAGRFNLAMEPGFGHVLVGVYDPRSLDPGVAAIVLTPVDTAAERRALVAHELAHHTHNACHLSGDSEAFAESIEAVFRESRSPERLAAAPTRVQPQRPAAAPPQRPMPSSGRAPALSRSQARRAQALRAHRNRGR